MPGTSRAPELRPRSGPSARSHCVGPAAPPTLVKLSVMAVASIGRPDTGVVPGWTHRVAYHSRVCYVTCITISVRGYTLVSSVHGSVMIEHTASPGLGVDLPDRLLAVRAAEGDDDSFALLV